jgi:serine/threonine protein kinase/tetratricopeptide (TPR) repeat protein
MVVKRPDLEDIFFAARQLGPQNRAAYLDEMCGDDAALRQRVEQFLAAQADLGSFLESPAAASPLATIDDPIREGPDTVIGPYQLLEQVGEGGFGVVFMAEQTQPVRRKVALKILKPGMDTRQVVARFEAERQALALMDHPNIARVFDGGATASGRPYFVMELVKGDPITEYCDQNQLAPRERLGLFLSVCQAVQHAHQKGIIHRDLKPSNVLVAWHDTMPTVKVIDFGIAKALGQALTDKTVITGFAQMVGTPLYMSPEQAGQSGLDVDTRSDTYSLGVLLYELLTGTTPFDRERFKRAAFDEIRRIIREEEPPRPSTRLSESKEMLPSISAQRHTEPTKLTKLVRGDLDWIVMKALEKDRNRRYDTASAFAADVQRYLNNEPVQARPPSTWYRLRKFTQRNKAPVLAVAAVVLALAGGFIGTTIGYLQADSAQRVAQDEWRRAEREKDQAQANAREADKNFRMVMAAVERYFTTTSENPKLKSRGLEGLRKELLLAPREFYQKFIEQRRADPSLRAELGRAHMRLAFITDALGSKREAITLYQEALQIIEPLARAKPDEAALQRDLMRSYNSLALLYEDTGRLTETEKAYHRALELAEALTRKHPQDFKHRQDLGAILNNLAKLYLDRGNSNEAEAAYERARNIFEELTQKAAQRKEDDPLSESWLAQVYYNEGTLYRDTARSQKAEVSFEKARDVHHKLVKRYWDVPDAHKNLADAHHQLGIVYMETNRLKDAEAAFDQAHTIRRWLFDRHSEVPQYQYDLASTAANLGIVYARTGRPRETENTFVQVRGLYETLVQKHPEVLDYQEGLATTLDALGAVYMTTDRLKEARANYDQALVLFEKLLGKRPDYLVYARRMGGLEVHLGDLMRLGKQWQEALVWYGKAIERLETVHQKESRHPLGRKNLGHAYWKRSLALLPLGRAREALADRDRAIELDDANSRSNRVARIATLVLLDEHARALTDIDELATTADAETLYDLGCLCAASLEQTGNKAAQAEAYATRAVKLLRQAVARGLQKPARLRSDPRLALVSSRPDFRALLTELGVKAEPLAAGNLSGTLTRDDPLDSFPLTNKSHHKVHTVRLEADQPYLIDLKGQFDTFLRIEDSQKKPLLFNDDVQPPEDLNSRLVFIPSQKDTYRLVVTSYRAGDTGSYGLSIQKAIKVGKPVLVEDKLLETDKNNQGRYFKLSKVPLVGGSPYTIELESAHFDTYLVLLDDAGKKNLADNAGSALGNKQRSRLDFTPRVDATFTVVVASRTVGATGAYRLTVQRYETEKKKE